MSSKQDDVGIGRKQFLSLSAAAGAGAPVGGSAFGALGYTGAGTPCSWITENRSGAEPTPMRP